MRAVCLLSGGMDSTTLAYVAKDMGYGICALHFNYGQRTERKERECARKIAGLLRVEEGSLYPALHRLERDKFVHAEWRQSENGRRARYYSLTPSGRKRLGEATDHWQTVTRGIQKVLAQT